MKDDDHFRECFVADKTILCQAFTPRQCISWIATVKLWNIVNTLYQTWLSRMSAVFFLFGLMNMHEKVAPVTDRMLIRSPVYTPYSSYVRMIILYDNRWIVVLISTYYNKRNHLIVWLCYHYLPTLSSIVKVVVVVLLIAVLSLIAFEILIMTSTYHCRH